jgi:Lon protease-like protein
MRVPLFPLRTVLFPAGILPLRVFEARYMDMVRDCMKTDSPFGVCLITRGGEVGQAAQFEPVGCLASIVAWDMPQLGVLNIRTVGTQRFQVRERSTQADGLQVGEVDLIDPDEDSPLATQHQPCADLLRRIVADLEASRAERRSDGDEDDPASAMPFDRPYRFESSVWVGNRVCEVLNVPLKAKQKLMELDDAGARLDIITQYLRQHAIIK